MLAYTALPCVVEEKNCYCIGDWNAADFIYLVRLKLLKFVGWLFAVSGVEMGVRYAV